MSLIKTSLLNSISVFTKLVCALLLNKILAVYVGPGGFALIGQFQNFWSIWVGLAGGVFSPGLIKFTAQYFDDELKQHKAWQTAIRLSLYSSTFLGSILLIFGKQLSQWLLIRSEMVSLFWWMPLALPAVVASNLLLAIINGKKEVKIYIVSNIFSSILSLLLIGVLSYGFGLYGALLALIFTPGLVLFTTAALVARKNWFSPQLFWGRLDKDSVYGLTGFAAMGIVSAVMAPTTYIIVRNHISDLFGLEAAGFWQATWKISEVYLMLITTTLGLYYLPRLAEIKYAHHLREEVLKVYLFSLPIAIASAGLIFILRNYLVKMLFTPDFLPVVDLLPWQLAGDIVKIGSWVLAYVLIGRSMVRSFILTEVIFSFSFIGFSWLFISKYALAGVTVAYFVNYLLYWATMALIINWKIRRMPDYA